MSSVRLESVSKDFGGVLAVDAIDLEVQDQELLVLVGPSGCGKSTTLRMIAGLETPTAGTCLLYTSPSPRDGLLSRMPSSA